MNSTVKVNVDIYSVYTAIFNSNLTMQKKNVLLTSLHGANEWSWKVVGITKNALEHLATSGYRHTVKNGIQRAHIKNRIDTANSVFDRNNLKRPLAIQEFFDVIIANDKTVLAKKEENRKIALLEVIPINSEKILFPCEHIGYRYHQDTPDYLRQLHQDYCDGKVKLVLSGNC